MRRLLPLLAAVGLLVSACGDDEPSSAVTFEDPLSTTIAPPVLDGMLPPVDAIHAGAIFGDDLAGLGLRLTNRGGLIDRTDGQYRKSAVGTHYALYVEPIDDRYSDDEYADNLIALTAATAPPLFDRYPALESYDICQEPRSVDDDSPHPSPTTQVEMTRAQVAAVDWSTFDHDALAAAQDAGALVRISEALADHPELARYAD